MFNLNDCMAFVTSQSSKVFAEVMEKKLRPYNITRTQWIAMYYILTNEQLTQRELADMMSLKEPTIVRMLQKMELEGHLLRTGSTEDRRRKYLALSPSGEQLCLNLLPVVEKFKDDTTAGISPEHLQILKDSLEKMVENAMNQL